MAARQLTVDDVAQAVAALDEFRAKGATLIAASLKNPEAYRVCAQSAHGKVKYQTPAPYHYRSLTPAGLLDLWGMGYRVAGGKNAYQRNGVIYGFERSYPKALKDIQQKGKFLVNVKTPIEPNSVYLVPGYLIAITDFPKLQAALKVAYRAWADPGSVVGGWPASTENPSMATHAVTAVEKDNPPEVADDVESIAEGEALPLTPEVRLEPSVSPDDLEALRILDELERPVQASQRVEQALLRKYLLGTSATKGQCALCSRTMSDRYLVAAHIKQRSSCSDAEKLDFSNVAMLNCKFGCDELYEQGDISIGEDWSVIVGPSVIDEAVRAYVEETIQASIAPRPESAKYFAWHRQHHNFR